MATGIFAILDDIAMLMDDVAVVSKVAVKKTVGILGDDLAVNAEKAIGFPPSRELPVLWAITKASFVNKLIILPVAFLLSAFVPGLIIPILMAGGIYLAYEGAEKIYEYFVPHKEAHEKQKKHPVSLSRDELMTTEKAKIKSAVLTDFILSIEIIIIALSTVTGKPLSVQIIVVSLVAVVATAGVYGIVALIVRMDDFGYKLVTMSEGKNNLIKKSGELLVAALPKVIKLLAVIGTVAMLLVAGGIYVHNIHQLHDVLHSFPAVLAELLVGALLGAAALGLVKGFAKFFPRSRSGAAIL